MIAYCLFAKVKLRGLKSLTFHNLYWKFYIKLIFLDKNEMIFNNYILRIKSVPIKSNSVKSKLASVLGYFCEIKKENPDFNAIFCKFLCQWMNVPMFEFSCVYLANKNVVNRRTLELKIDFALWPAIAYSSIHSMNAPKTILNIYFHINMNECCRCFFVCLYVCICFSVLINVPIYVCLYACMKRCIKYFIYEWQ